MKHLSVYRVKRRTVSSLQGVRNQVSLVGVMKSGNRELELVRDLRKITLALAYMRSASLDN